MTDELTALTLAALLQAVQFVLMAVPANLQLGVGKTLSPRDNYRLEKPLEAQMGPRTARLNRALHNHFEGLILFTIAVLVIFFGSSIIGALAYTLIGSDVPLVGGYPAAYGLIGSYTFMLWLSYGATGKSRLNAFQLIGFLVGIQLLFGLLFGGNKDWFADFVGFGAGFGLSFFLVPGAFGRLLDKLRQR